MFRQGSITGVIGNRDTTWNKGKGVYVIVQLYTHLLYQRAFEIAILELEELADFLLLLPSSCVSNVITPIPLPLFSPVRSTVPLSRNRGSATRIGGKHKDKVLYRGIGGV